MTGAVGCSSVLVPNILPAAVILANASHIPETIIGLLAAVGLLMWAASRLRLPYPIFLVLGGLAIAFVPGLPSVALQPSMVFLLFLPPLLYHAGLMTSWRDFRANARPISLLAVALVLVTTVVVAVVAHYLTGMPWAAAFVLGAIISPPDAVAATSVLQRLRVPKRIVTILEGESLVNDATALVALSFAIEAARTGSFSLVSATGQFFVVALGGVVIGYFVGMVIAFFRKHVSHDDSLGVVLSLLTPYIAFLPAELCKVSGVLSVVTCGVYLGRLAPKLIGTTQRIRLFTVWDSLVLLLNGVVFILIGLTLPEVVKRLGTDTLFTLTMHTLLIGLAAIAVRALLVAPVGWYERLPRSWLVLIGWAGMRGIVSLAAALAIPLLIADEKPFPYRDEIVFITFGVILITLVGQGLTLGPLVRLLKLDAGDQDARELALARRELAFAALARLDVMEITDGTAPNLIEEVRREYAHRVKRFERTIRAAEETVVGALPEEEPCGTVHDIQRVALLAERDMLIKLRDDGHISDEILRHVQNELDIEELRLSAGTD
jgi:monovalent cation/hydrogen antiporter